LTYQISVALQHEMTIPGVQADFVGYKIPNKFVVGYGLDCEWFFRFLFCSLLIPMCVVVCCSVLPCVAVCCSVLLSNKFVVGYGLNCELFIFHFSFIVYCRYPRVLQCVAVCCSMLQYVAVCCTVLHCVALCCSVCCSPTSLWLATGSTVRCFRCVMTH